MSMNQDPRGPQEPYQPQSQQQPPEGTWQPQSSPFNQPPPMPKQDWQGPPPQPFYQQQQQPGQWQPQPGYPPQPFPQPGYPPQPFPQRQPGYPPQPFPQQGYLPQQPQGYPQQPYPYPQQPYLPQMPMQPMQMVNTVVNVNTQQAGHGFFIRALYFLFIGWWAGYIWLNIGFALCAFIITLPIGLAMLNRIPQVLTLRPQSAPQANVQVATVAGYGSVTNIVNVNITNTQQHNMLIRALYFLFIGGWLGYLWANLGYFLCVSILGLPLGLMMLNRLPAVLTLRKN